MAIKVDFDAREPHVHGRPLMPCRLHGRGTPRYGTVVRFTAFLDTGADYLTLPSQWAQRVGLSLTNAVPVSVLGATGPATVHRLKVDVTFDLLNRRISLPVDFFPHAIPLVGLDALWRLHTVTAVEQADWLYKA
jgi:predicted aspartyl protease